MAIRWEDLDDQDDEDAWWAALACEPPVASAPGILERGRPPSGPRWQQRAACAGLGPVLFSSTDEDDVAVARAVCAGCAVRGPCGRLAMDSSERFGVWAGLDRAGRRRKLG